MCKSAFLLQNQRQDVVTVSADLRAFRFCQLIDMPVSLLIPFIYPRVITLHDMDSICGSIKQGADGEDEIILPKYKWPSAAHLDEKGIMLLDAGSDLYLWFDQDADSAAVESLFGVCELPDDVALLRPLQLLERNNDLSKRVNSLVREHLRRHRCHRSHTVLRIVKQGTSVEDEMVSRLIEDKAGSIASYVETLCDMHRKIQHRMNGYE